MYLNDKLPQGETETKTDPYTLPALIAWLRTQPADREYQWYDVCGCLMHFYYFEACGIAAPAKELKADFEKPFGSNRNYHRVGAWLPWTFGAALARAEALAREAP